MDGQIDTADDWKYEETDRYLKEHFTNELNKETMIAEIIRELTSKNDTKTVTRSQV